MSGFSLKKQENQVSYTAGFHLGKSFCLFFFFNEFASILHSVNTTTCVLTKTKKVAFSAKTFLYIPLTMSWRPDPGVQFVPNNNPALTSRLRRPAKGQEVRLASEERK